MKTLAIIPARGGSKGIPGKNLKMLAGKPLIAWMLEAARACKQISRTVVSTDNERIASTAEKWGAQIVKRPAVLSTDTASSESALVHVIETLRKKERIKPDLVVFLQCTSPLTATEDIHGAIQLLIEKDVDCVFSATRAHLHLWRQNGSGCWAGLNHDERKRLRRQDRPDELVETGAIYVMRAKGFLEAKHRFFGKVLPYVVERKRSIEIDEPVDLALAEAMLVRQKITGDLNKLPLSVEGLVLDFDGVFTDNRVRVSQGGMESVTCHRGDGLGLTRLRQRGLPMVVLSLEKNPVVTVRCRKLGLNVEQGVENKLAVLKKWARKNNLRLENIVYLGNDVNDVPCLEAVGCGIVVADAVPEAKTAAKVILSKRGGLGAIRELCDLILKKEANNGKSS